MDKYRIVKKIGSGSQAVAFLAQDVKNPERLVVLKRMPQGTFSSAEMHVMLKMHHPHIIACYEAFQHEDFLYLVLQYAEGGDLEQYIEKLRASNKKIPVEQIVRWFVQICSALQYCHDNRVIHRDIKPENIFLSGDYSNVYVGDFGVAKVLEKTLSVATTLVGSPIILSPEVISGTPYTYMSDAWSLGCVLYEMTAMQKPFTANNFAHLVTKVCSAQFEPLPKGTADYLVAAIHGLLNVDVNERWVISDVLASHEAFQQLQSPDDVGGGLDLQAWVLMKQREFEKIDKYLRRYKEGDDFLLKQCEKRTPKVDLQRPKTEDPSRDVKPLRAKRILPQLGEPPRCQTPPSAKKCKGSHSRSRSEEFIEPPLEQGKKQFANEGEKRVDHKVQQKERVPSLEKCERPNPRGQQPRPPQGEVQPPKMKAPSKQLKSPPPPPAETACKAISKAPTPAEKHPARPPPDIPPVSPISAKTPAKTPPPQQTDTAKDKEKQKKYECDRQNLRAMIQQQRAQQKTAATVNVEIVLPTNLRNLPQNQL